MTRRERRNIRNAVLITAGIVLLFALIGASVSARWAVRDTLNRIAGSCVDEQISSFIVAGHIFFCRPYYRNRPTRGNQQ